MKYFAFLGIDFDTDGPPSDLMERMRKCGDGATSFLTSIQVTDKSLKYLDLVINLDGQINDNCAQVLFTIMFEFYETFADLMYLIDGEFEERGNLSWNIAGRWEKYHDASAVSMEAAFNHSEAYFIERFERFV